MKNLKNLSSNNLIFQFSKVKYFNQPHQYLYISFLQPFDRTRKNTSYIQTTHTHAHTFSLKNSHRDIILGCLACQSFPPLSRHDATYRKVAHTSLRFPLSLLHTPEVNSVGIRARIDIYIVSLLTGCAPPYYWPRRKIEFVCINRGYVNALSRSK